MNELVDKEGIVELEKKVTSPTKDSDESGSDGDDDFNIEEELKKRQQEKA